jgi:L,D-transpeptidase catalytic domain/Putative peptidoglycan binding domain
VDISGTFRFTFGSVLRTFVALVAAAGTACAAAPAAEEVHAIVPGVRLLGANLGGLTAQPARNRIEAIARRPITIWYRGKALTISPAALGARADVDRAVQSALAAQQSRRIHLRVQYSDEAVTRFVDRLAKRFDVAPRPAKILGATDARPLIRPGKPGLAVQKETMRLALEQQLAAGSRAPLVLMMSVVKPAKDVDNIGPVIVIDRASNTLKLFSSERFVRAFHVATGQAIYPTPKGMFDIVTKQRNPWWYPPTYDEWAKGLKPVPPGPGNPLGTRWMGLSASGVGIHGTDADSSIGYSLSHGCIRMHIPDAEWLFERVHVGTTVVIL